MREEGTMGLSKVKKGVTWSTSAGEEEPTGYVGFLICEKHYGFAKLGGGTKVTSIR